MLRLNIGIIPIEGNWAMQYIKTSAGNDALQQRSKQLSAKQRQLLFLLGTEDFDKLPASSRERLLQPEMLEDLLALGFIEEQAEPEPVETTEPPPAHHTPSTSNVLSQVLQRYTQPQARPTLAEEIAEEQAQADFQKSIAPPPVVIDTPLTLTAMREMMVNALQQYSGIMAKALTEKVRQCQTVNELRSCHMAWVTLLQETRLPAAQLHSMVKRLQKFYQVCDAENYSS